jgi:ferredoxin-fold anticodon binding domain-containing protein
MTDVVGAVVHVGQVVTYPGRWSSTLYVNVGVVRKIEGDDVLVQRIEKGKLGKLVWLQRPDRLTVSTMGAEGLLDEE